jgi:hypothetical protein
VQMIWKNYKAWGGEGGEGGGRRGGGGEHPSFHQSVRR